MKKIFFIILCVLLLLSGCNKNDNKNKEERVIYDGRTLVLYFSVTGNTGKLASKISKITKADIMEIVPEVRYTNEDIDYNNSASRASIEQNNENARPIIGSTLNVKNYDTVFIGYPIWFGTNPKIILSLFDTYDLHGKKIVLFCTSGSTDISTSLDSIKKYDKKLKIVGAKRFDSNVSNEELVAWLNGLDIKKSEN